MPHIFIDFLNTTYPSIIYRRYTLPCPCETVQSDLRYTYNHKSCGQCQNHEECGQTLIVWIQEEVMILIREKTKQRKTYVYLCDKMYTLLVCISMLWGQCL